MVTVTLDLSVLQESNGVRRVVAQERGNPLPGGNIGAKNNDIIIWHHGGGTTHRFVVNFYKFPNLTKRDWPFKPVDPTKTLYVETSADNPRTFGVGWHVYYSVKVDSDEAIAPLDPMIIIRGQNSSALLAAALLGAVVGATLAYLVLSNTVAG